MAYTDKARLREYNREYYRTHKEARRATGRKSYEKRKEKCRDMARAYYAAHKEERRAYAAKHREEYPEETRAALRASYARHAQKRRAEARERASLPSVRQKRRKYLRSPKAKEYRYGREAKKRARAGAVVDFTAEEWEALLTEHECCAYCGQPFDLFRKPTRDHVVPLIRGGNHTKDNILPACPSCNCSKGARPVEEFREALANSA